MNNQIGNKINDKTYIPLPPFKGWVLENFPFIEDDFDCLTNYQMLCLMFKKLNEVISNQNQVQKLGSELVVLYNALVDAVNSAINEFETEVTADINQFKIDTNTEISNFETSITSKFNELKDYVDNFFDNNFPEMVSDKLDEMAQDGTLTNLLYSYASLIKVYNNINDLKNDEHIANNMNVKTLGYYSVNDGGNGFYKIRTKTNDDTIDEMFIISLYDETLIAELIIDENTNVKTIGAYGDDIHNDDTYFNNFIQKLNKLIVPTGTYKINTSIYLNNINVYIDGSINYTGDNYLFIIENSMYKNINISSITSTSGGGLKLIPSSNSQSIIYCDFNIGQISVKLESIFIDGSLGSISLNNFIANRLRSSDLETIKMLINNGSSTWITENNFIGIDIKSPNHKGVSAICSGTSCEIQYKLSNCDLEDCKGIYSKGNITYITLLNCRLLEISSHNNWITIEDYLPVITILGEGILYPKRIELININSNSNFILTNMDILVNENGYYYHGGAINKNFISRSDFNYLMTKEITDSDLTDSHYYTLPNGYNENQYNYFTLNTSAWVEITVPNTLNYYEFYFRSISNGINVTFKCSNATTTINSMEAGFYKMNIIGGRVLYTKLNQ